MTILCVLTAMVAQAQSKVKVQSVHLKDGKVINQVVSKLCQ